MLLKKIPIGIVGGTMPNTYQPIIGLEVHAELKTASKMFCGCKNDPFGAEKPNIYTCPVCLGMPGALPVANKKAIEWTIKLGLALNCKINLFSKFDRKHYFYPDLPKGYQISQYDIPFCYEGHLDTNEGRVGITRIHLEEDTAKLVHKEVDNKKVSLIDFNRSSVPLVEIVTEPDIKTATQAKEYAKKLKQILKYLDIADCNMDQGGMRLEANISLSRHPVILSSCLPDYKVEIKNINSFKFLEQGINYEIKRQDELLNNNQKITQETRGYNASSGKTYIQRTKEDAADYRYFPDPDLPPFEFSQDFIDKLKADLPKLPEEICKDWQERFDLESNLGIEFTKSAQQAEWFNNLLVASKKASIDLNKLAKNIINKNVKVTNNVEEVILAFQDLNKTDNINEQELELTIKKVLENNQDAVEKIRAGKQEVMGFLIGQVMRELGKKADSNLVRKQILEKL